MTGRFFLVLALSLSSFSSVALADHLPGNLQSRGRPESSLAGVDLKRAKLADIIKLYGQPTKVEGVDSHNPGIADSFNYTWIKSDLNLHVVIERISGKRKLEFVSFIEVDVGTSRRNGRTGAGLRLGDNLRDFRRIYGNRFKERNIPKLEIHDLVIQWHREEYTLEVWLDQNDRIIAFALAAPE